MRDPLERQSGSRSDENTPTAATGNTPGSGLDSTYRLDSASTRRSVLSTLGAGAVGTFLGGTALADRVDTTRSSAHGTLELLGHHPGERPQLDAGIYTQGSVRDDGQYGVLGGYSGTIGTTLFDLSDPEQPELLHRLPSDEAHRQNGVKFLEATDGIYLRTMEDGSDPSGPTNGFQVVDYGWGEATATEPAVIATFEVTGGVHKLDTHREEPVAYVTESGHDTPGTWVVDLSDPENPQKVTEVGPSGYDHGPWVDMQREFLYGAYIHGEFEGIAIRDISDPYDPQTIGQVSYDDRPGYQTIGEAGFSSCHFVAHDPERDLLVVGDEKGSGIPGGKHVWDIGWDDGSPQQPDHLGFTHSPNAESQGSDEPFFWTTHMHDIVPGSHTDGGRTLVVDGGYHEGTWLCDITDPTDPQPANQHIHHERANVGALEAVPPVNQSFEPLHLPFAWSAEYNRERQFVFTSDSLGGAYTFGVSDEEFTFQGAGTAFAGNRKPTDRVDTSALRTALHYWFDHSYYPNSGRQPMDSAALIDVIEHWSD